MSNPAARAPGDVLVHLRRATSPEGCYFVAIRGIPSGRAGLSGSW